jgi:hypothetical protein
MTNFDPIQASEAILRYDALYRLLQRRNTPALYQEICYLAQQYVRSRLFEFLSESSPTPERFAELSAIIQSETWRQILREEQLKALAIYVQQQPSESLSFQKAIDVLIRALLLSNHLKKRPEWVSEEAYREAQCLLQLWIYQNIQRFDPSRGSFLAWINFHFDKRHFAEATELKRNKQFGFTTNVDDLDLPSASSEDSSGSNLLLWLQEDYIFRIPNRDKPEVTFLDLVLARSLNQSWQEIADRFGFNWFTTPHNFFKQWLDRLTTPLVETKTGSSLYKIRLSRFEGESWTHLARKFEVNEVNLKQIHQDQIKKFRSYQDVTKSDRYKILIVDNPPIAFSTLTQILLESGHLWQEPALQLKTDPMELKTLYLKNLQTLWSQSRFLDPS